MATKRIGTIKGSARVYQTAVSEVPFEDLLVLNGLNLPKENDPEIDPEKKKRWRKNLETTTIDEEVGLEYGDDGEDPFLEGEKLIDAYGWTREYDDQN